MLVRPFRGPYDTGGGTSRVETGVWAVTLVVIAELTVNRGLVLCVPGQYRGLLGK